MSKKKKTALGVLAVLACLLAAVGFWQRNNLEALRLFLKYSNDDLQTQMEDSHQEMADSAKDKADVTIRDLTEEEKQALKENTLSREEILQEMVRPVDPAQPENPEKPQPDPDREQLTKCMAELYLMQEEYNTWLEDANQAAIDEFVALPPEEQTTTNKYQIGFRYLGLAKDKEKECDARMAQLETKIRDLLVKLGEDTSLVEEIHETYLNEKALKKAHYLGLHG